MLPVPFTEDITFILYTRLPFMRIRTWERNVRGVQFQLDKQKMNNKLSWCVIYRRWEWIRWCQTISLLTSCAQEWGLFQA